MSLNMPERDWILLNVPEYASKNCSDYARILNMSQYSYNNIIIVIIIIIIIIIIIVTNVITLECLSTWFPDPGALLPFYLF